VRLPRLFLLASLAGLGVVAVADAAAGAPTASSGYSITDLGSLGYGVTDGLAINAGGQVAGYSYLPTPIPIKCPPHKYGPKQCFTHYYHAFLYSGGTMSDLGTLGGNNNQGTAINRTGEVVGWASTPTGCSDSFLWNGRTMIDLGALGAAGINDSGQVAGTCGSNPGTEACLYSNGSTAHLSDPTTFAPLNCGASAIDDNGQVVGNCDDTSSDLHAVLWQNGAATDLGTFGGPQASAAAINNLGQIVGWAQTSSDADHGFLWSNGKMTDLGNNFFPAAINDDGVVVGGNLIYSAGTLHDLDTLIPAGSPYQIDYANGINDNGQIVADAYDTATNQGHAILLTPN
jgi:probable HAF family extracellular repeat protein